MRRKLFWDVGASCARPVLSRYGEAVSEELLHLSAVYENVELDKAVIMPNHIHMILKLKESGRAQLAPTVPRVIQQFKGFYDRIIELRGK